MTNVLIWVKAELGEEVFKIFRREQDWKASEKNIQKEKESSSAKLLAKKLFISAKKHRKKIPVPIQQMLLDL